jgi:predicted peroxiredoxin
MKKLNHFFRLLVVMFAIFGLFSFVQMVVSPSGTAVAANETGQTETAQMQDPAPTPRGPEDLANGLFINLTTDDIDRAAMAIGFATKVLNNTDKPVTIFMNTQGGRLADTNIPQNIHKSGKTMGEMLQKFMDDGGVALVCPVCMVNVGGMAEEDVMDGVIIGSPEYTWSAMFAENVTVLSY